MGRHRDRPEGCLVTLYLHSGNRRCIGGGQGYCLKSHHQLEPSVQTCEFMGTFHIQTLPQAGGGRRRTHKMFGSQLPVCFLKQLHHANQPSRLRTLQAPRSSLFQVPFLSCCPALQGRHHRDLHHRGPAESGMELPGSETIPSVLTSR